MFFKKLLISFILLEKQNNMKILSFVYKSSLNQSVDSSPRQCQIIREKPFMNIMCTINSHIFNKQTKNSIINYFKKTLIKRLKSYFYWRSFFNETFIQIQRSKNIAIIRELMMFLILFFQESLWRDVGKKLYLFSYYSKLNFLFIYMQ